MATGHARYLAMMAVLACARLGPSAASSGDAGSSGPDAATEVKFVDTHAHIFPTTTTENNAYLDALATVARAESVKIALGLHARHIPHRPPTYSTEHDTWTLAAVARHPDVFIATLNGFDPNDNAAPQYVKTELATGRWKMIGELDLRNSVKQTTTPANHSNMKAIYALAAEYKVPVMIHYVCSLPDCTGGDTELIEVLLAYPTTNFINAHTCRGNLMNTYPNLFCEYEVQTLTTLPDAGVLGRVMLGSDVQNADATVGFGPGTNKPYAEVVGMWRQLVSQMSAENSASVSVGTARKLKIIE